jgi:hypothetical protein
MATNKANGQEKEQWLRLYALAERLDRLDPWQWMGGADCFGVEMPGWDEPCFVVFGGESKAFRHVRFLLGWKAFYDLVTRLADPSKQVTTWLLEIRMIELLFVTGDLLFEHEQNLLKTLTRQADATYSTPVFRSIIPGYHPWLPEARERDLLETVLYQAYGMAMRVEADNMLLKTRFPREILMRKQDAKGVWQDTWSPVKEVGDEEVEVRIESKRLQSLRTLPLKPVTMQLDLIFTPLQILPDGQRPQTAYVLLAVDAKSGFIMAGDLLQATEGIARMWSLIPERLLEIFERLGGCPATIELATDRMANLLRPLGEFLPFKMVRRERLALLEAAREHLSAYITRQESREDERV